ncbi:DUF1365 domain-containing protein [Marinicella sp. S1101]|uniref:DUF1365 domain-containing protein n=1 Tax=Marinicella marina TaxID=2996016 RepID=UPI002260E290|nr:DUF1365 domain-containing protein [Marinicella marina]MCX7553925.1 DUF1365 domain-containing protein [Marinicella marina]MDJ1140417.1 DUF1365 domain-containing protein [Marinicella marina]
MTKPAPSNSHCQVYTKLSKADGFVIHSRRTPKNHRFKYRMCWFFLDLKHLDDLAGQSKLFAHNKWGITAIHDKDYINPSSQPIITKLSAFIKQKTGKDYEGDAWLFTHPRFLGYGFNSVNFYFCYQDRQLLYIVSEINNTPWGEKHLYLHDFLDHKTILDAADNHHVFEFDKQFHISPFVPMDVHYCWKFRVEKEHLSIKMSLNKNDVNVMNVVLDTNITPIMENEVNRVVFSRPFQCWKMSLGIYWQAFKLWIKKVPIFDHPATKKPEK